MASTPKTPRVDIMRSPLGRARGLGSSHSGAATWWGHTLSSIALVPLTLWFIFSVIRLLGASREDLAIWLSSPIALVLMIALIVTTFYHMWHGLETVLEDYVHQPAARVASLVAVRWASALLGLACIVSVLRLGL